MTTTQASAEESQKTQKISMSLPVKVEFSLADGERREEITHSKDASLFGAGFSLTHPVKRGSLVFMTISMPRDLRIYDLSEAQYKIWGIVRRCIQVKSKTNGESLYSVGVGFIGRNPPASHLNDPLKNYDIASRDKNGFWVITETSGNSDEGFIPNSRRRHSRFKIPTDLKIEILDDGIPVAIEDTVSENISYGGAAILCSFEVEVGSFVRITSEKYSISIISIIRGTHMGENKIQHIHVEFIDQFFPVEGITQ